MPASPSTPRLYRIVFVFWESSAFERYSLWNYWVCWDSSRFDILSDRKPLFYIRNSLFFARNHWKPSVKPIISTRCWLLFHRNDICWYVIMYENAGTGYHPVTPFWWKLLVFVVWDSSAFGKYSLWNYWICWDSSRLGIHFDRKPLFYTTNSIGMHTCLMKMYGFLKEFIDFQWKV